MTWIEIGILLGIAGPLESRPLAAPLNPPADHIGNNHRHSNVDMYQTETDLEVAKTRNPRLAPAALIPLVTQLAPGISSFMSKLLHPLITSIAHRPDSSPYKAQLLQKFTSRALTGTKIENTGVERAIEHSIQQKQYEIALNALKSHEIPLNLHKYYPEDGLGNDKHSVFRHMTVMIDQVLQNKLLALNHVNSNFLSSVVEQSQIHYRKSIKTRTRYIWV